MDPVIADNRFAVNDQCRAVVGGERKDVIAALGDGEVGIKDHAEAVLVLFRWFKRDQILLQFSGRGRGEGGKVRQFFPFSGVEGVADI